MKNIKYANRKNTERKSNLDKALYSVDELSNFIVACVLVRLSKILKKYGHFRWGICLKWFFIK